MNTQNANIQHSKIRVLLTIENGEVINTQPVRDDEFTATMETFFWIAGKAGYQVIPPANESTNDTDSNPRS